MVTGPPAAIRKEEPELAARSEFREQWTLIAILFLIQVFAFGIAAALFATILLYFLKRKTD